MVNTQAIKARRELLAIYEVSKTLATSLDIAKTFREALNYLVNVFDWRRAFVLLAEPGATLRGLCAVGLSREEQERLIYRAGEGIIGRVFANGIQLMVPDVLAEPLFLNRVGGADQMPGVPVALLVTPISAERRTVGLLESELFGHEKGAFTGAQGLRKGRFEMAHGGTLFLDEIGDISSAFQAKLLRVLQEREFERVGGSSPVKVDVRLIMATNRNLERMVKDGEFRADLYYRINVVSIQLPPLRERREDIPAMAQHFLDKFNTENARATQISPAAMRVLSSCYWPGNVRELENCIERTATMAQGDVITHFDFPCQGNHCLTQVLHHIDRVDAVTPMRLADIPITEVPMAPAGAPPASVPAALDDDGLKEVVPPSSETALAEGDGKPEGERERLIWAMERCGWVQAKAARLLKISPRQMGYALQKNGIEVRKF